MQLYSIAVDKGCEIAVGTLVHVDNGTLRGDFKVTSLWVLNTIHIEIEILRTWQAARYQVIAIEDVGF